MLIHRNPCYVPKISSLHQGKWDYVKLALSARTWGPTEARTWGHEVWLLPWWTDFFQPFLDLLKVAILIKTCWHMFWFWPISLLCTESAAGLLLMCSAFSLWCLCCLILQPGILLPAEIHQLFLKTAKRLLKKWFCWRTNLLNIRWISKDKFTH